MLLADVAALVAGAAVMAAGEYVSVRAQADIEQADLATEAQELAAHPGAERDELTHIHIARGLAAEAASQMTRHDALGRHTRDELGLSDLAPPRPFQAALASAAAFSAGAVLPWAVVLVSPHAWVLPVVGASVLVCVGLAVISARASGAPLGRTIARITIWSAAAMRVTSLAGPWVSVAV